MAIQLREANLTDDEDTLIALAQSYLGAKDEKRFRWLYRENPFGLARAWLAFDNRTAVPIGMAALFPRLGYVAGKQVLGCILGDFCVSQEYRSLGPAVQLQRACLSLIQAGQFAFCYDFPSTAMLGVYRYLGLQPSGQSVRMVKLLRADETVRRVAGRLVVSGVISKVINFALAWSEPEIPDADGVDYRLEEQPCSAAYSRLAERVGSSLGSCTLRNREYLNWRYRQHPSEHYEFLAAYRGEELQAYCIFTLSNGYAAIVDLFGGPSDEILSGLLIRLLRLLRSRGASTVSLSVLAGDPRMRLLRTRGFWSRESVPVIGCGPDLSNFGSRLLLMHGDRES